MLSRELLDEGRRVMSVCNACRYCEAYCPVFPAMERRRAWSTADLAYLANLCHNCGECLYACQYAPPHEFGINVPRTLAHIRLASYLASCWPRPLAALFTRPFAAAAATAALSATLLALLASRFGTAPRQPADFYAVLPHGVLVLLFSTAALFAAAAMAAAWVRVQRGIAADAAPAGSDPLTPRLPIRALVGGAGDALTLRYLHGSGADCTDDEETRRPWRRWFHHCTFYGFALCVASTTVAAIYHELFGWMAPYSYTSLPVVLGTIGGVGLLIGPAGLLALGARRDEALGGGAPMRRLDRALIAALLATSATGLLLLALRERPSMPVWLVVHLASVLAFFLTLPYSKFVHGLHRLAALVRFAAESDA